MAFGGFRLYNPCCDIFYIQTLWYRLADSHPSKADVLVGALMSADHHLESLVSRLASFLRYQSLLHRNRAQNPNDCSSKARNEWKLLGVDVKRIVDAVVGEQDHLDCEVLDWMEAGEEPASSVRDRKTNCLKALSMVLSSCCLNCCLNLQRVNPDG